MTIAFVFIASFYILSMCWFTPVAGTDAVNGNHTKAVSVITVISLIIAGSSTLVL